MRNVPRDTTARPSPQEHPVRAIACPAVSIAGHRDTRSRSCAADARVPGSTRSGSGPVWRRVHGVLRGRPGLRTRRCWTARGRHRGSPRAAPRRLAGGLRA